MRLASLSSLKSIFFLILVVGLIVALMLVGREQFFRPRATNTHIQILDQSGNSLPQENNIPVTNDLGIKIRLDAPAP